MFESILLVIYESPPNTPAIIINGENLEGHQEQMCVW